MGFIVYNLSNCASLCILDVDSEGTVKLHVKKWCNNLALKSPNSFAEESSIEQGTVVDVSLVEGKMVVAPVTDKKYTLKELLNGVTKRNIHGEIDAGSSVEKELW